MDLRFWGKLPKGVNEIWTVLKLINKLQKFQAHLAQAHVTAILHSFPRQDGFQTGSGPIQDQFEMVSDRFEMGSKRVRDVLKYLFFHCRRRGQGPLGRGDGIRKNSENISKIPKRK